jgi:hypothetical protein
MTRAILYIAIVAIMSFLQSSCSTQQQKSSKTKMSSVPPSQIDSALVLEYIILDTTQTKTGKTTHIVAGETVETVFGLAICKYSDDQGFYLFYCNRYWKTITDTYHDTIDKAKEQAEHEFSNTRTAWTKLE